MSARIQSKLISLAQNPYAQNNNAKKLQDDDGYRLRVGDWRVIYEIEDQKLLVFIVRIAPRGKVWREYRGLTQQKLAAAAGISAAYLSQIETGKRAGKTAVLQAIARAMNLDLDDVVYNPPPDETVQ